MIRPFHFDRETLEQTISDKFNEGQTVQEIALDFQNAYSLNFIDEETFFTAREIYLKAAGIYTTINSDGEEDVFIPTATDRHPLRPIEY